MATLKLKKEAPVTFDSIRIERAKAWVAINGYGNWDIEDKVKRRELRKIWRSEFTHGMNQRNKFYWKHVVEAIREETPA